MSKINIIFGSMGNQLANYKIEKKQKNRGNRNKQAIEKSK